MSEYSRILGELVYKHRKKLKMTQAELAELSGVTEQTIRKIEHFDSNPQLEVLVPLIRALHIDPAEFFYPENVNDSPAGKELEMLIAQCSEAQIEAILPVVRAAIELLQCELVTAIK